MAELASVNRGRPYLGACLEPSYGLIDFENQPTGPIF